MSAQGDAIRNLTGAHRIMGYMDNDYTSGVFHTDNIATTASDPHELSALQTTKSNETITFDASRVVPTANENRPRNIAFHYICLAA